MAVIEIHGFPGAGKTTVLTMIAQRALLGKTTLDIPPKKAVYTTFECPGCYKLNWGDLGKYYIHDALLIVDELGLLADNRKYKSFSDDLTYFFKMHRHANLTLIWASQSASDVDLKIRMVTERSYIIDKYFCFTAIKPILKKHTVKSGQPEISFELAPPYMWSWCLRPLWYAYFDSYDFKALPDYCPESWQVGIDSLPERKRKTKEKFFCGLKKILKLKK